MILLVGLGDSSFAQGDSPGSDTGLNLFSERVLPLLRKHCYECHSHESDEAEGGLVLDSRAGWQKGGTLGPAVVPGNPEKSLLMRAVLYQDKELQMPPDGKLPADDVESLRRWIVAGAADPREGPVKAPNSRASYAVSAADLWSLRPVSRASVPAVVDVSWPRHDLDRFILARLEKAEIEPVSDAVPETLLRRICFDLTGLPPSIDQLDRVLKDPGRTTLVAIVDELIDSPAFGERWGRHWLDTARYADTLGGDRDRPMRFAWRYRNWVIDAINTDLPYDRFLTEQLAGDLLPAENWQQRERQLIATGFLAVGSKPLPRILPIQTEQEQTAEYEQAANDWADDQIDAVGRGMLGLTVACARCHDHKFDPIPTRDYYALAGIFHSTELRFSMPYFLIADAPDEDYPFEPWYYITGEPGAVERAEKMVLQWQQADIDRRPLRARLRMLTAAINRAEALSARNGESLSVAERLLLDRLPSMKAELAEVRQQFVDAGKIAGPKPEVRLAIGAREAASVIDVPVLLKGQWDQKRNVVPRGFLSCISGPLTMEIPLTSSGRLELARWITHPEHQLTARVAVNRVWHHLLGRGIVESLDNFGSTGAKPTHPELLDWLAHRFIHEHNWSLKRFVREIVISRTYQLAAVHSDEAFAKDPSVELFWRMRPRRLEAEALRDALLQVGGRLTLERPTQNPLAAARYTNNTSGDKEASLFEQGNHRSIYTPVVRGRLTEFQVQFDQPVPDEVNSARNTSTLASQALFMMNGSLAQSTAQAVADRILNDRMLVDEEARLLRLYAVVLARRPSAEEGKADRQLLASFSSGASNPGELRQAWSSLCLSMLMSADFLYRF